MATIPKKIKETLVKAQYEKIPHFSNIIRRKNEKCPHLPKHFNEKPVAYYEGLRDATYSFIEEVLMDHNQYKGFQEENGIQYYYGI